MVGTHPLHPSDGGDRVWGRLVGEIAELLDLARMCTPGVYTRSETDGENIVGRPVDQIEIVVILQIGKVSLSSVEGAESALTARSGASNTFQGTLLKVLGAFFGDSSSL